MTKKKYIEPSSYIYHLKSKSSLCLGSVGGSTDNAAKQFNSGFDDSEDFDDESATKN